jgi:hypothetical protein
MMQLLRGTPVPNEALKHAVVRVEIQRRWQVLQSQKRPVSRVTTV